MLAGYSATNDSYMFFANCAVIQFAAGDSL